jgi:hypothetical protein
MEQTAGFASHEVRDRRTGLVAALAAAGLLGLATIALVLTGTPEDVGYGPGSPEAVMQAYAQAWEAGDADTAWALFTPRAQTRVRQYELRSAMSWSEDVPTRIWVEQRRDLDDRVELDLAVERSWDGLLGPDREIEPLRVTLIRLDDAWRIDTPLVGFHRR